MHPNAKQNKKKQKETKQELSLYSLADACAKINEPLKINSICICLLQLHDDTIGTYKVGRKISYFMCLICHHRFHVKHEVLFAILADKELDFQGTFLEAQQKINVNVLYICDICVFFVYYYTFFLTDFCFSKLGRKNAKFVFALGMRLS